MPRFFNKITDDNPIIDGENARHIIKSLRMTAGEIVTVCDNGIDYTCEITGINGQQISLKTLNQKPCENEPSVCVTLLQALPKYDKMELIIEKAVELGACEIVPFISDRCISRPDAASVIKKTDRWNKISASACKQSERGKLVPVREAISLENAAAMIKSFDKTLLFYENGGLAIDEILNGIEKSICIIIGPEGGFSDKERTRLQEIGASDTNLGKRILRSETAVIVASALAMKELEQW